MRVAFDTNVLAYAEGINDLARRNAAIEIIRALAVDDTFLPVQVVGELFRVLRRAKYSPAEARSAVLRWQDTFPLIETSPSVLRTAIDLATDHDFSIWDAIIISAAAEAGCRLLLSEDLHDGFTWSGVTVANPFATKPHSLLARLLQ